MSTHIFGKSSLEHAILKSIGEMKREKQILAFDDNIGGYDAGNNVISNVSSPRSGGDAVNRRYLNANAMTLNGDQTEFHAKDKIISHVGDPVAEKDAINKHFLEKRVLLKDKQNNFNAENCTVTNLKDPETESDAINMSYLKRYVTYAIHDLFTRDLDVGGNKIINCERPQTDFDVVNKIFLDQWLSLNNSIMLLTLNGIDKNDHLIFMPYGTPYFVVPFDCSIKLSWANFAETDVTIIKDKVILEHFFDRNYHGFTKGSHLSVKAKSRITDKTYYLQININCFL